MSSRGIIQTIQLGNVIYVASTANCPTGEDAWCGEGRGGGGGGEAVRGRG